MALVRSFEDVEPPGGKAPSGAAGDEATNDDPAANVDEVVRGPRGSYPELELKLCTAIWLALVGSINVVAPPGGKAPSGTAGNEDFKDDPATDVDEGTCN